MKKKRNWTGNLLALLCIALVLGAWIMLPWQGAIVVAVLLALWLVLTRSGRLALAATRIGIASLPQRWGASSVIIIGIAGVVGVLVAMLAMGAGFEATLRQTGGDDTAILLRGGSQAETNSVITRDLAPLVGALPGIARDAQGRPATSPEASQVVNLPTASTGEDANAQFRGVSDAAWAIRPNVRIVEGRKFEAGLRELIVGQGAKQQYRGLDVGKTIRLGNQQWTVVGTFASGDAFDSELWTDYESLAAAYDRRAFQSITVALQGKDGLKQLKAAVEATRA